jgi:3-oxoacyl-[acyl-carrier protein] reductase
VRCRILKTVRIGDGRIVNGNLIGRLAIVTGATGGLGSAIALRLAESGAIVVVGYLKNATVALQVATEIRGAGGEAFPAQFDITNVNSLAGDLDKLARSHGSIDVLVNNAGSLPRPSAWKFVDETSWQESVDVNLRGTFNCIRWAQPYLVKSQHASIVNIASTTGAVLASPGAIAYGAAKAGVISVTRTMAKALAPTVRVNAVCPGIIDAGMTGTSSATFLAEHRDKTLMGRLGTAKEVADSVVSSHRIQRATSSERF